MTRVWLDLCRHPCDASNCGMGEEAVCLSNVDGRDDRKAADLVSRRAHWLCPLYVCLRLSRRTAALDACEVRA